MLVNNYKLTLPRAILLIVILGGGIVYFGQKGIDAISTVDVLLAIALLFILIFGLVRGTQKVDN